MPVVDATSRLTVWQARIPCDGATLDNEPRDHLRQIAHADLAGFTAEVDGLRAVVWLSSQQNTFGSILDVEVIARGSTGAPCHDRLLLAVAGLDALAHQRGNDMAGLKIEVVTGSVEVRRQRKDRVEAELA